jgi:hypothetical protein
MFIITDKDGKTVIFIRILANFRIFEYNYEFHVGRAKIFNDIEDLLVRNVSAINGSKTDEYGVFIYSDNAVEGCEKSTKEIKTIGNITFIIKEGPFVTFESVGNPDHMAQIITFQKEKIVSFKTDIILSKNISNWNESFDEDPFHIPSLLGKDCCAICKKVLGFKKYTPKKEWNIDGRVCSECFNNPTKLGVRPISSEEDFSMACALCAKNVYYFEFESENLLCFSCFEKKYGKVLLTANRAEYYGGHKVHLAGGTFSDYESGKIYLTDEHFIFAKWNEDISERWEIIIPLRSVLKEQWDVKGESRRKQIIGGGGALTDSTVLGGGVIHESGKRHRLLIPYIDENRIIQQPVFGVSSFRGKEIRKLAEKLYELLSISRWQSSLNIEWGEIGHPIDIIKLRLAKVEITTAEYEELRKIIET